MAGQTEALILQMSVDIRRMEKALAQVRGQTNRQLGEVEKRFDKMNDHVRRSGDDMARDLRSSIAAIGVGLALREVVDYGDAWTTARNKLAAAGVSQDKLAGTMSELVDLAKATRSEFDGTVDLYAKLTRAGQQLNLTQEEVARITKTTLQAFVAGGAAASEQAAAITQLSQALGSGVLQGDELKSIRENAPLLAQAIAKEFNTTIAGLKDLGAEGVLTADRVAKAILNADGISDAFGKTISTVAQAMTNLRTEFTRYIAESRIAQTVIGALGGFIQLVTDNIDLLADAAIVAASVIGGTLAVAAIGRFVASLSNMVVSMRAAQNGMAALRLAMTFFSGPIGAVVLGLGAALLSLATHTEESASAADRARDAFAAVEKIQGEMATNQKGLAAAQDALTKAIQEGGEAAKIASALEVERFRKNLAGNKAMLAVETARAAIAVRDRQREFQTKPSGIEGLGLLKDLPLANVYGSFALPELSKRGVSGAEFVEQMAIKAQTKDLTADEDALRKIVSAAIAYDDEITALKANLADLNKIRTTMESGDVLAMPTIDDGKGGGGKGGGGVKGYQTDLERLTATMNELAAAAKKDADAFNAADMALQSFEDNSNASPDDFYAELDKRREQAVAFQEAQAKNAVERSREAVQAILDFAQGGDIAAAFAQIPSVSDFLIGDDEQLLRAKLTELADTAAASVATGLDKMAADFAEAFAKIEDARRAAVAAGVTDLAQFDRAAQELFDNLDAAIEDRTAVDSPWENLDYTALSKTDLPDFEVIGEEFRQIMRDSVKSAFREGIQTGDWGDAFQSILADALTAGLDGALNRVGDWLGDFLFGSGGLLDGIVSGVGSWIGGSMFGRATGGSVYGGQTVMVGENGPEILRMGKGQMGQVLNASMTRQALGGGSAPSIYAPMIIQGSVDAVTWPRVEAAMRRQARVIMSSVPHAVNGTLIDNRIQKRRL